MKKILGVIITVALMALTTVPVFAGTEITYGVVLDTEGNGIEIDVNTNKPIDPYYNYIAYSKVNAKPGTIVMTIATTNEYGEWESRKDYPTKKMVTEREIQRYKEIQEKATELSNLVYGK